MRRLAYLFGLLLIVSFVLSACKSKPAPAEGVSPPAPSAALFFDRIEAGDPSRLILHFTLEVRNPISSACRIKIESWRAEVNGRRADSGFSLHYSESGFPVGAMASASFPLKLDMDVAALAALGLAPADDYEVKLITQLDFAFDSAPPVKTEVSCLAVFPGVRAPEFNITAIAILKAELINTRFRVTMRIDNPNPFPVELSAFNYTLYGNGKLWADGAERNVLRVPAKSSLEGNLFLLMNFIDMDRNLLDQIVNLIDVNYRFTGEAQVSTGVEYLPRFSTGFDLSGYSEVLER